MDMTHIDTPQQLAQANERGLTPTERAIRELKEVGAEDTMMICRWLVDNLREFHHDVATNLQDDNQPNSAWVFDEAKLTTALQLLREVDCSS